MDQVDYDAAKIIKQNQDQIDRVLAVLATGAFTPATLLQAYTVLGDATDYTDYVGSLYTSAPTVSFTGGGGADAAATAVITDGIVTEVNITSPGTGYTTPPTIVFTGGGGSGAYAVAVLSGDTVGSATVINRSLVALLKAKDAALEDEFAAL